LSISPISSVSATRTSGTASSDNANMLQELQKLLAQLRKQLDKIEEMDTDSMTRQQLEETLRTRIAQVYSEIMAIKKSI